MSDARAGVTDTGGLSEAEVEELLSVFKTDGKLFLNM